MKLTKKITFTIGVVAAGVSYAQTPAASTSGDGLLGHRYTELSVGIQNIDQLSDHGYSVGASANNPIVPGVLDAGAAYSYSWIRGPFKGHANTIGAYTTAYAPLHGVKPFAGAALGYQWTSFRFVGSDDQALWGLTAGVEIPAGPGLTITPRINYADDFESSRNSSQQWTYEVEANYWVNRSTAAFVSLGKSDVNRSPLDSWNFEVGLRARF